MTHQEKEDATLEEAAAWFSRMKTHSIEAGTLEQFFAWQTIPGNREAFARVEAMWRKGAGLEEDPDIQRAIEEALSRKDEPQRRWLSRVRPYPAIAASILAAALLVTAAISLSSRGETYETAVGEHRDLKLADGSRIQLDTNSRLNVRFDRSKRIVDLQRGQALFDVAHDQTRPFVVSAGQTKVRALGTQFDVRRDTKTVHVTLLSGKVSVSDGAAPGGTGWTLSPGQQVATGADSSPPKTVDPATVTSWTAGHLVFRQSSLSSAIDEANRYSRRQIKLAAGEEIAAVRVNGVFDTGDVDALAAAVAQLYDLETRTLANGDIQLRQPSP